MGGRAFVSLPGGARVDPEGQPGIAGPAADQATDSKTAAMP